MRPVLLLFSFLLFLSFVSVAQEGNNIPDENLPFILTNPDDIYVNFDDPLEEIFGSQQNTFGPLGLRGRGNLFTCTTDRIISSHRLFLNLTAASPLWFCIYEGDAAVGTYNQVSAVLVSNQGPGQGWYSSGPVNVTLQAGKFYLIYAQWDATANYYTQNPVSPYPFPCSFGELTAGAGWHTGSVPTYGNPPPATQNILASAFGDPVAYYQMIISEVIPVELSSFTASITDKNVTLNWTTASELNNHGFEIQRKTDDNWEVIGFVDGYGTSTEERSYSYTDDISRITSNFILYRLKQIDFDGTYEYSFIVEVEGVIPTMYSLEQNYPNPFNPSTSIKYQMPQDGFVTIKVFDILGNEVTTLVNEAKEAGNHIVEFDASEISSGIYFYTIQTGNFTQTKKMTLMK
jgi:hypothetical protein